MKIFATISIVLIYITLNSATTAIAKSAKDKCFNKDWLTAGFDSSKNGYTHQEGWEKSDKKCAKQNIWSNKSEFTRGYEKGKAFFCSQKNGFEFGRRNLDYQPICDEQTQRDFDTAFKDGRKLYEAIKQLNKTESDLSKTKESIEHATRRRKELGRDIDSGKLDEKAENKAVKERYKLKTKRDSLREKVTPLKLKKQDADHAKTLLQRALLEKYYPSTQDSQSAYSKDQSLFSESIEVSQPAILLYEPPKYKRGKSAYKKQIKAIGKHITKQYPRKLRYQIVHDINVTFSRPGQPSIEVDPAGEFHEQPYLLIWSNQTLERHALNIKSPIKMNLIDSAAKKILLQLSTQDDELTNKID